ncbi:LPXTG-site transpeptidase (sortase) family protein [Actinoalloteichus hoggarensis]|uniref:Sortase family protein n=1 Tax=Actinoalloteichus hoggarensis TaxID=1470176 RepID=A0A221VVX5_9PSEU|nr:class E sortase [Actinoalloteichus hoggarensis]ASO17699.1 Sortase family protein [Actinoalloteichus hoggarensis]MBB5922824.1 LPXTG-site transpeptidase (sortase) family protein [Actinoalloteichus hoggarensis]
MPPVPGAGPQPTAGLGEPGQGGRPAPPNLSTRSNPAFPPPPPPQQPVRQDTGLESRLGSRLDGDLDDAGDAGPRSLLDPDAGMPTRQIPQVARQAGPPVQTAGRGQPAEPVTELIAPVADEDVDDYYEDEYDDRHVDRDDHRDGDLDDGPADEEHEAAARSERRRPKKQAPARKKDSAGRILARSGGELMLTAGFVVLLFVFYELFVTGWFTSARQAQADSRMEEQWQAGENEREAGFEPMEGEAFARIFVPKFGPDYRYSIVEGTSDEHLEVGPGHYVDTAMPGERGNFAVAGHRVGWDSPFNNLDLLESCDAIVIEGATEWFVYRVLPMENEIADWETTRANRPECTDVPSLVDPTVEGGGVYGNTPGQQIVAPSQGEVILPVPSNPGAEVDEADQRALITLTTCHPRFSARERMIIHGLLTAQYPKDGEGAQLPPELSQ